jgi:hypothetical protein
MTAPRHLWGIIELVAVLLLGGLSGYVWYISDGGAITEQLRPEITDKVAQIERQKVVSVALPELKLNRVNVRQAPEITVNPDAFGKENPFQGQ